MLNKIAYCSICLNLTHSWGFDSGDYLSYYSLKIHPIYRSSLCQTLIMKARIKRTCEFIYEAAAKRLKERRALLKLTDSKIAGDFEPKIVNDD